jgi:lipopolysaccharide transport system ATP-binding protein
MSAIALSVDGLSKEYRLGVRGGDPTGSLRDILGAALSNPFRRGRTARPQAKAHAPGETIWAVRDVSFQVREGESVGIVGRNGAGKSTLLKILSRITEPSRGHADIYGRVGSLLEVGTGFHPELTGRENVFLNGALLGMHRSEIARKFDAIVAFAEIEKFIDTPVKFYSSGMYVRLAFAVAAHLEPEILIVDEVLAVGDIRFQRKCLNLMQEGTMAGRTVLFVSHSMSAVTRLCTRAVMLEEGRLVADGPAGQVAAMYLSAGRGTSAAREWELDHAPGGQAVRLLGVRVIDQGGEPGDVIDCRHPFVVELEYEVLMAGCILTPHFHLVNEDGLKAFTALDLDPAWRQRPRPAGRYVSRARVPGNLLAEGLFAIHPAMKVFSPVREEFAVPSATTFQVIDTFSGDSARGDWAGNLEGVVRPMLEWDTPVSPSGPEHP